MDKKGRSLEKKLAVVLGILGIIVLGLGVGVAVVNLNQKSSEEMAIDDGDASQDDTESEQNIISFYDAEYKIFDYYDGIAMLSDSTTEEEIQKYIAQTLEYIDELHNNYDDPASRINITIAEVWFLQGFNNYAEEAIQVGKEIEGENLSSDQKYLLYEYMGNAYRSLGDENTASQYYALSAEYEPIFNDNSEEE